MDAKVTFLEVLSTLAWLTKFGNNDSHFILEFDKQWQLPYLQRISTDEGSTFFAK
jgi:hypothetical protein